MATPRTEELGNPSALPIDSDNLVLLQVRLGYRQCKAFARDFAGKINQMADMLGVARPDAAPGADLAASLAEFGYARAGSLLSPSQIKDLLDYFAERPCYNAHVVAQSDQIGRRADELAATAHFGSYHGQDVVKAPHILEIANSPRILSAVGAYLGCTPSLYSMNAWWSFPRPEEGIAVTQAFHRDLDDYKNCVLFLYLTDTPDDGRHEYIRYSHDPDMLSQHLGRIGKLTINRPNGQKLLVTDGLDELFQGTGYGFDDVYGALFPKLVEPIAGMAGEGFLTDPDGLHRATLPLKKRRLIVWLRYGLHRNSAYVRDLTQPVPRAAVAGRLPDTPEARFVNRLVIDPN